MYMVHCTMHLPFLAVGWIETKWMNGSKFELDTQYLVQSVNKLKRKRVLKCIKIHIVGFPEVSGWTQ